MPALLALLFVSIVAFPVYQVLSAMVMTDDVWTHFSCGFVAYMVAFAWIRSMGGKS